VAVSLVGTVVNSCDATTGFSIGSISTDDDFVEGSGAIGVKNSASTASMYTTSISGGPYDFSSGGGQFGYHVIMWFNSKSPINATTGFRIVVGNGNDRGNWYVVPAGFYKGGFVTAVVNTARNFDVITAGTWSTTNNPAQLTAITQVGGVHTTPASIMGSFNNFQLDQMTIGLGVRVDGGTVGTPNTFETVRAADEDTNFWGWWSSKNGQNVGKGKLYIGPATGSATSVFTDTAFAVVFADERVAAGFYEIRTRGAGTDVTWTLGNIRAANPASARWSLTVDSDTNTFADTAGVWVGADTITLRSSCTLENTALIDCTKLVQNGATLSGLAVRDANTADGVAFVDSDNPALITDSDFTFSDGHAIRITAPGTYTFTNLTFTGYGSTGSNDAAIYNDSGGAVTINVSGGTTPTYRNGAGASTTVNAQQVTHTVNGLDAGSRVVWIRVSDGVELENKAESSGVATYTYSASDAGTAVDVQILDLNKLNKLVSISLAATNETLPASQADDRFFANP